MSARRANLQSLVLSQGSHAGLLLTRYLKSHQSGSDGGGKPEITALHEAIVRLSPPDIYTVALQRWRESVQTAGWVVLEATTNAPLVIGMGNENPTEVGLTVHPTYGMPLIPGSAVKGVCRRAVETQSHLTDTQRNILFGDQVNAGACLYADAWYVPATPEEKPFQQDIITVHHQDYYGRHGGDPPTDFDDPNPVPFLSISTGTRFLFAVKVPPGWEEFVRAALQHAITERGLGGKTNAGYGVFTVKSPAKEQGNASGQDSDARILTDIETKIAAIRDASGTSRIEGILRLVDTLQSPTHQAQMVGKLHQKLVTLRLWKESNQGKTWYVALAQRLPPP